METRQHTTFRAFIKQHAVLTFYILVFALCWGPTLIIVGPGALLGTGAQPTSAAGLGPFAYLVNLADPLIIALAGIQVIASPLAGQACAICDRGCSGGGWAFAGTRSRS